MLNNRYFRPLKKVSVQRKPNGEVLGIALWIGGEVLSHLPENLRENPVLLKKGDRREELDLENSDIQKVGSRTLGIGLWIPEQAIREVALEDEAEISVGVDGQRLVVEVGDLGGS